MDVSQLVPLGQAAKRTARSEWTLRRLLRLGELEGAQVGRDWFLTVDEVNRLAMEYPVEPVLYGSGNSREENRVDR